MIKDFATTKTSVLIGSGRSGKTTIVKLFLYHMLNQVFDENELMHIFTSIAFDIHKLVDSFENLAFFKQKYQKLFEDMYLVDVDEHDIIANFRILKSLWKEKEIQSLYEKRFELNINVNDHLPQ